MDIGSFLHCTVFEVEALEKRLAVHRSFEYARYRTAKARAEALEAELGRVSMLARALAELCLSKGLVTRAELAQKMLETPSAPIRVPAAKRVPKRRRSR